MASDPTTPRIVYWISNALGDVIPNEDGTTSHTVGLGDLPAGFWVDGVPRSRILVGSFPASVNRSVTPNVGESRAGAVPATYTSTNNDTPIQFQEYAQNLGPGWQCMTAQAWNAIQLPFIVEYATLDSSVLGFDVLSGSAPATTGYTAGYGGTDKGNMSYGSTADMVTPTSYRGIESLVGNVYQFLQGLSINNSTQTNRPWVLPQTLLNTNYTPAACGAPYVDTGVSIATLFTITPYTTPDLWSMFLPKVGGDGSTTPVGSSSTHFCDYVGTQPDTNQFIYAGGAFDVGSTINGLFCWFGADFAWSPPDVGFRLQYMGY